jgi:L-iditol 2-dehydrogenase
VHNLKKVQLIMTTMKVAMYYNNRDVRIEEMPIPDIDDDELLIKVMASGICGSDVMEWYRIKKAPRVLGHEIAGDIIKIGDNVQGYHEGDRVFVSHHVPCDECTYCHQDHHTLCQTLRTTNFYPGGFAEYLKVPEINVQKGTFKLPDELSYEDGVFIEPLACVVRGLHIARFKKGQTALVIGSGISGILHIKLLQALGAQTIIATDINEYRINKAQEFGADMVFNAHDNIPQKITEHIDGTLPDVVVTCTGAPSAVSHAVNSVGKGGTILFFAPTKPGVNVPLPLFELWNKGVTMVSTYAGSPSDIHEAITLIKNGRVTVTDMITHRLSLDDIAIGFRLVADAHDSLKVVIKPHKK